MCYTVPVTVDPSRMPEKLAVRFRVNNVFRDHFVSVFFDNDRILHRKRSVMAPGEMEEIHLKKEFFDGREIPAKITIRVEEA